MKLKAYDSSLLLREYNGPACTLLVDQGLEDNFLKQNQLQPESLVEASKENSLVSVDLRNREGYDHSYYFIATFIEEHFDFHARNLQQN
jgi:S-formylglutathione hydrolase